MANEPKGGLENLDKELGALYQPKAQQAKPTSRRGAAGAKATKKKAVVKKPILSKGKRKRAVARASLIPGGSGRVTVNGVDINLIKPKEIRELMLEAIKVTKAAQQIASGANISVSAYGGGFSGQAQAVRTAIAKVILKASPSPDALRNFYMEYDRNLLIDDTRRVEPKKFKGPKARARFQKSYR
ncbi:MAG: 30S ribosomal protein S9 [Candidatus Micrarchaeaceae archaeon]